MSKSKENYGDLLSKYIVEKLSGKPVCWVLPKKIKWYHNKLHYISIGSILQHSTKFSLVWGSGIINEELPIRSKKIYAVRGPKTREYLLKNNIACPEIYGDPALLLPELFNPEINKKYEIGIVPHYVDYGNVKKRYINNSSVKVIDLMTNNIEKTTCEILECQSIVSSSLHGVIVAHAYQIPAVCVKFSNNIFGSGIKFKDYYASVNMPFNQITIEMNNADTECLKKIISGSARIPDINVITTLQNGLIKSCPFI